MRTQLTDRGRVFLLSSALAAAAMAMSACGDESGLPSGHWHGSGGTDPGTSSSSGGGATAGSSGSAGGGTPAANGSSSGGASGSGSGGGSTVTGSSGGSGGAGSSSGASGGSSGANGSSGSSGGSSGSSSGAPAGSSSGGSPQTPNLAVSVDKATLQMQLLAKSTVQVSIAPNGFSGSATLEAGALPQGVTATFAPSTVTLDGTATATATLTLSTVDSTPPGTVSVDVQAVAQGVAAHAAVGVEVQSVLTIHIPAGVNSLGGTTSNPVTDAYGPYPLKITAPAGMSSSTPVTIYFMNDDARSHEIHADNPQQGFGHDPGSIPAHAMDSYVRKVTTPGSYDFYLHDQGAPITIGLVQIQ